MTLLDSIIHEIHQQGDMPFAEFMHRALYAPHVGYYSAGTQKLGILGDFVTAPELTPLFGYALAHQCQQVLAVLSNPVMFEFGAGTGRLCVDILTYLEQHQCLPTVYYILEVSEDFQQRQRALITDLLPHLIDRVIWLSEWPSEPFQGVIVANEVLDAMPVHRFLQTDQGVLEGYVTCNEAGSLQEIFKPCGNQRLVDYVQRTLSSAPQPYQSEANLLMEGWFAQSAAMLERGAFFVIDYGFPRHEYYHPDRNQGTLMCHYRHQASTNPLLHVGEQDITAHVDFTQVAESGFAAGFHVAGYTNQASFLLGNGLLPLITAIEDERIKIQTHQAVKQLLQPQDMGELFKVMALTKHIDLPLYGFQWQDKRASL